MKKITALLLCLALGMLALSGCSDGREPFEEKSYTPDGAVSSVSIDVRDRSVEVSLSDDGLVHLRYSESSEEYYDIAVADGVLSMTAASGKDWTDFIGGKPAAGDRRIFVQVPDALLDSITISTTNEDVSLGAVSVAGSVSLSSNGGSIEFESLDAGQAISLNAKNGDITGSVVGGYDDFDISVESKKGESNLPESKPGGEKTLSVSCNNGDVSIEFTGG